MRNSSILIGVMLGLFLVPGLLTADDGHAPEGRQYTVIRWSTDLQVGGDIVAKAGLADELTVTRETDRWLWVPARKAWLHQQDAVASGDAVGHFNQVVQEEPSAETFHQRAVFQFRQGEYESALADLTEAHRRDAKNVAVLNDRGNLLRRLGKLDVALSDFNEVVRLGAKHPTVFTNRGLVHQAAGDHDRALSDFNAAVQMDEQFAPAWEAAGSSRYATGDFPKALQNFRRAVKLDPNFALAQNNLAWLLATCPDKDVRDGEAAVSAAEQACELTGFAKVRFLDTLAAAHAEAGDFDQAVERATQAIELADQARHPAMQSRLELYKSGQPLRHTPTEDEPASGSNR